MTAPELVEVVAGALYRSVVSFPGELHPTLSELPKRQQDKYHRHARAVLAALTEAGTVEFGVKGDGRVKEYGRDRRRAQLAARGRQATFVSRLTLPWTKVVEQ